MLCTATLLFSCTANDEPISEETSFLNQIKTSFNPNAFTDFGGGENWDIDWNNYTKLTKDSAQIYTFALKAKNETKIQSDLFQEKVVHQIVGFKKGQKALTYLLEVKSNIESSLYTNDITHLGNFNGIASVYTFNKELLGTITFSSGKANNYSRNKELDALTAVFNLYYAPKLSAKIPSCKMTYFIYDLRYVDRYEVWSVGGNVILTKYLGQQLINSTKTSTTVTYPCDSPSNTDDKYVVYRTNSYSYKQMKINDSNLKPCLQTILSKLKTLTKGVGQIVVNFAGDIPNYNWNLKSGELGGATGATNPPALYDFSTGSITTTLDSQSWTNATDLSWARTILHESIHAYLATQFAINRQDFASTYPTMVSEWGVMQNWNNIHHEEIARSIVNEVAISLEEYGKNNGYNLPSQFYQDMAWGGLQETSTFKNLPLAEQQRILNVISTELTGADINGNIKQQFGKRAGC